MGNRTGYHDWDAAITKPKPCDTDFGTMQQAKRDKPQQGAILNEKEKKKKLLEAGIRTTPVI